MSCSILVSHEGQYGINSSVSALRDGRSGLDVIEIGIREVEDDHRARTVGFGGAPNILGDMECDASIMVGATLEVAALGALKGCKNPISAARQLLGAIPHVMLVGDGASRFAREKGVPESSLLSEEARSCYDQWLGAEGLLDKKSELPNLALAPYISFDTRRDISKGTVTFLVRDSAGHMYGGVSTSGWAYKYPGRLGDSPIIGAGLYVDNRYGGASCTNTGEMTIRTLTSRSVVLYMKMGATVEEACREAMKDLRDLKTGYLGPVVLHAMDSKDGYFVCTSGGDDGDLGYYWAEELSEVVTITPTLVEA